MAQRGRDYFLGQLAEPAPPEQEAPPAVASLQPASWQLQAPPSPVQPQDDGDAEDEISRAQAQLAKSGSVSADGKSEADEDDDVLNLPDQLPSIMLARGRSSGALAHCCLLCG